ncbi:hypothetical protein D3C81_1365160 [compost metagenome]
MMIRNYNIHANMISIRDLINRTNSRIYRYNKCNASFMSLFQCMNMKSISFLRAMRNVILKISV